jgi:hypothetical protein
MATYTVRVLGVCSGGEHVSLNVLRDGDVIKKICFTKTEILDPASIEWENVLIHFMRQAIKKSGATTLAQAKTAVEAMSLEL